MLSYFYSSQTAKNINDDSELRHWISAINFLSGVCNKPFADKSRKVSWTLRKVRLFFAEFALEERQFNRKLVTFQMFRRSHKSECLENMGYFNSLTFRKSLLLDTELAVLQLAFKRSQMFPTSGNDPFEHKHKLGHAAMDYEAHAFEAAARSATTSRD